MALTKESIELNQKISNNENITKQLRENYKAAATELSEQKNETKQLRDELDKLRSETHRDFMNSSRQLSGQNVGSDHGSLSDHNFSSKINPKVQPKQPDDGYFSNRIIQEHEDPFGISGGLKKPVVNNFPP